MSLDNKAFYIYANDVEPDLVEDLTDDDGQPVLMTDVTQVKLVLTGGNSGTYVAEIVDGFPARVKYQWEGSETPNATLTYRRWELVTPAGSFHVPNYGKGYPVVVTD